ncbi:MAG: hypothetical protein QOF01_172 [Thermomicrobiales bacterium]|jgi:hypothetical protein|nr:hypothetical protein [Thermomicrobiales bacterium]MEA2522859.1 hypothetical protein [Thermomicrobiales bacterium]MEA2593703.1 hypothetical protein [Thermomicrobiales bacterium]
MQSNPGQLLSFTLNPKLDAALQSGWEAWYDTARSEGPMRVTAWLAQRLRNPALKADLRDTIESLLSSDESEERALALSEIAEIAEGHDDLVADTLWEGVLAAGLESDDPDLIFEATSHLAAIAEDHGDPLAAAEYYLDFLNWRRHDDHASDAEAVESAFDEIIRLAELDGDRRAAALFGFRQAQFTRLAEADEERASSGDWESEPAPYQSWA